MHSLLQLVVPCALAASLAAQRTVTIPRGFDNVESLSAPASTAHPFHAKFARYQLLDSSLVGTPILGIQKLELRRDGETAAGTFPARTTNLQLLIAHGNAATFSTQFAANYVGAPVKVVASKAFNFPDLSAAGPSPAPFGISIPFDSGMKFDYDGSHELLIEFQCDTTTPDSKPWPLEAVDSSAPGVGQVGFFESFGYCTTANGPFLIFARPPETSSAGQVTITTYALGAPNLAAGALALGFSDPNLPNVFCARLRTSADLVVPVTASATGEMGTATTPLVLRGPYSADLTLYLQYVALDPLQAPLPGVALSDGAKARVVGPTRKVQLLRTSATSATLPPTALPSGQRSPLLGLVMRLSYP